MEAWVIWFIAAGLVLGLEILTGTFYLIMISIGMAAAGVAALCGVDANLQAVIAAVVWISSTSILRKTRFGKRAQVPSETDPNVNIDIGQTIKVDSWTSEKTARVSYRGAMWDVELISGEPETGTFKIREVRGSRLLVEKN
ncbi:hypothetical protein D3C87_1334370 [compost metagenome]